MELPARANGDMLLPSGELTDIRRRLRTLAGKNDLRSVIACAFDHRTRMLPFVYADIRMVPAGVRAVGSAMVESGFDKTRIVLQQWNRRFSPSQMQLDGAMPDLLMVSSMKIHSTSAKALVRDACRIDPRNRPLIVVGGPAFLYEPWLGFSADPEDPASADVAVTGEEYVLLNLLEVVLSIRGDGESLRSAFGRARDSGMLEEIPGLVYARGDSGGVAEELVDTGIQRLVMDLDELPHPAHGFSLLEPRSRRRTLGSAAIPDHKVRKHNPLASLVLTMGCRFGCPYCPIPAYNQRNYRTKSGERIAEEMSRLISTYGIRFFFGTDDNFFNDPPRAIDIAETLVRTKLNDTHTVGQRVRWGTEATVHDTLRVRDHLRLMRKAGLRAVWLGVEDMSGSLVKKGQAANETVEAFGLLRERGICPMSMMMHHDAQPLLTLGRNDGLLNQIKILRKASTVNMQVLMITPATGSKLYEETYTSGMAFESVGRRRVEPNMMDGNFVVASNARRPWRKQFNILSAYLYFYNPLRFLWSVVRPKSSMYLADAGMQVLGMAGLVRTIRRTVGWGFRLMFRKIHRHTHPPVSDIPMRSVEGGEAAHAIPGTPQAIEDRVTEAPAHAAAGVGD